MDGTTYSTFKEAWIAYGLLDDMNEWSEALAKASEWTTTPELRSTMLIFSKVLCPDILCEEHWEDLTDYLPRRFQQQRNHNAEISMEERKNLGLYELELLLNKHGRSLKDYPPMPIASLETTYQLNNRLIREQLDYDVSQEAKHLGLYLRTMNVDQFHIFQSVITTHESGNGCFFVYGSGGIGKTYLWKAIIAHYRSKGLIVLLVASSGIATLLLPFGKTAHLMFKISIAITETSSCSISKQSQLAGLIREASLIIWDKASMSHRFMPKAVECTFRDKCNSNEVFGGKMFIFGGDFRQVLPIVTKGSRADIVAASISRATFWPHCNIHNLRVNMRLMHSNLNHHEHDRLRCSAEWTLSIGNENVQGHSFLGSSQLDWIEIPQEFLIPNDANGILHLIDFVYPNFTMRYQDISYFEDRFILTPLNIDVDDLNSRILAMLPGDSRTYFSSDTFLPSNTKSTIEDINLLEILHGMNFTGFPNHELQLKVGAPVVLLRSLDASNGLCNGTRLIIT